jgi:hypothetical protein
MNELLKQMFLDQEMLASLAFVALTGLMFFGVKVVCRLDQGKSKVLGFIVGMAFFSSIVWAGATFSRVKTWSSGETLTAADLNAEFDNVLNNLTPSGVDDYSASTTEMRAVADPYPASVESLATSLQGEVERLRYQILEIKKAIQASNVSYWYQDLPTAGVFTIAGSSVGVNDTTPSYALDVTGAANVTGNLIVGGTISSTSSFVVAYSTYSQELPVSGAATNIDFGEETIDSLSEFNGSTFTATNAGNYLISATVQINFQMLANGFSVYIYKNGSVWKETMYRESTNTDGQSFKIPLHISDVLVLSAGDTMTVRVSWISNAGFLQGTRSTSLFIRRLS